MNEARETILFYEKFVNKYHNEFEWVDKFMIELIDCDYYAGSHGSDGGDYSCLLLWLEKTGRSYPIRIHSMNPVGVANIRRIIERNGWREIK